MVLRSKGAARARRLSWVVLAWVMLAALLLATAGRLQAHEAGQAPAMDNAMSSAGWAQHAFIKLEHEAMNDAGMLPETPDAIAREWRTFDREGSPLGALIAVGWVAVAACLALAAERGTARCLSRGVRRAIRERPDGSTLGSLLLLLVCDIVALLIFAGVFVASRHWLVRVSGISVPLLILSVNVLVRWRVAAVVVRAVLRPNIAAARLIALTDREAHGLARFLSATVLAAIALIAFGRYGLLDEDSGAPHVVALAVSVAVCGLYGWILLRSRAAMEALIRGRSGGLLGALRAALAQAWMPIGLVLVASLFLFFVFGLSLGLLSYYHAMVSTLGIWFVLLVLDRLSELGWGHATPAAGASHIDGLVAQSLRRILRSAALLLAAVALAWIWADALQIAATAAERTVRAAIAAAGTLFVACVVWELIRVAIDRQLQGAPTGPKLPGAGDEEEEGGPGSRLQTVLPMLRIMIGALIAVVATLVVLAGLGVNTAPLIAGAGVFGLAISFGSQSLVRDIISGLFYMWDDAFRIGEYIDTGRLKGTVEALGIRSVKVRHHNGPLHTIPYGQLGSVTNMSRDFATIKFNLRLEPGSDIELVRKTAKKIGMAMQEEPEIASEVILPLKMQGIADVADTAVIVRFKFTARPIKPSWIQREYLKRMYRIFAEQGIRFASGTLTLQTVGTTAGASVATAPSATADITPLALAEAAAVRVA